MSLLIADKPKDAWIRTCQECGHRQVAIAPDPSKPLTDSYCNSKCRKCKSEALDYGTKNYSSDDWLKD